MRSTHLHHEGLTALKFAAVGLVGLLADITVLRLMLLAGLHSLPARAVSLACAMQVTFLINGLIVFRCLTPRACARQWAVYMTTNGFGNLCNWGVYAALVTSGLPVVSHRGWAVLAGSFTAYLLNYLAARLLVFGPPQRARARRTPAEAMCAAAEPSPRRRSAPAVGP